MRTIIILAAVCLATSAASAGGFSSVHAKSGPHLGSVSCETPARDPRTSDNCVPPGAELDMINIQTMVSQRQMAVQTASRMLAAMDCEQCIANIGK